jgi:ArsR family transcriptional regulator
VTIPLYQAKAEFFRTLGHPARIRVLELLSERDHAVHELLAAIDIEPSNLSQQLRDHGEVVYSINVPEVHDLLVAARSILRKVHDRQDYASSEAATSAIA